VAGAVWVVSRYLLRFRFNLPIAIAMVWITNPLTVIPIYYLYLLTGDWALQNFKELGDPMTYAQFKQAFAALLDRPDLRWEQRIVEGVVLLFWEFGWPMTVGSLFWTIPFTVLSYPVAAIGLRRYRKRLAVEEGLSYEEWNRKYVQSNGNLIPPLPAAHSPAPPES
jgi:uncharacterized protein (DUF2062 family)